MVNQAKGIDVLVVQETFEDPKYHKHVLVDGEEKVAGDPVAQLLLDDQIEAGPKTYDKNGYWPGEDFTPQCRD